jgi:tRNA-intron endonuclease, archaea type
MYVILNKNKKNLKIENNSQKNKLISKGFGYKINLDYYLDLFEGFYLFEKNKIKIKDTNKKIISKKELIEICNNKIRCFEDKYIVFKEYRDCGKIIKDGAIFGFDFRVYKNSKEHTHTQEVIDVKQTYKDTMKDIIKSERLANSINAKYILVIIDNQKKIIKIKIERI